MLRKNVFFKFQYNEYEHGGKSDLKIVTVIIIPKKNLHQKYKSSSNDVLKLRITKSVDECGIEHYNDRKQF